MNDLLSPLRRPATLLLLGLLGAAAHAQTPPPATDASMLQLASRSGCMACHHVDPGAAGPQGLAPVGPAWRDVAVKYRGKSGALESLTRTVLQGSNPYESHWKGKASGLAMPPNAVAIQEADARELVRWILALPPKS
jgi:cytochrome c